MARMPGAVWDPLAADWADQPRMRAHNIICIHTMVGSLEGTDSLFRFSNGRGYDGTESHFGTGYDGRIEQWQDTEHQAEANKDGNGDVISIENADYGTGFPKWDLRDSNQLPPFTEAQIESIAQIVAWACALYDIPCELVPDTKPGRRGVAYHRQGCDPYRVPGGVLWSLSYGKGCPTPARIAQIPRIIARARQIISGATAPAPVPVQEDDMPFMLSVKKTATARDLYFCGPGFAEQVKEGSDDAELRQKEHLPVYDVGTDLGTRVVRALRAGGSIRDDLADEEPAADAANG